MSGPDDYDDEYLDDLYDEQGLEDACDCVDADLDILTGIEHCHICGRSRMLGGEEFSRRLKQEAEWADADYAEIEKEALGEAATEVASKLETEA